MRQLMLFLAGWLLWGTPAGYSQVVAPDARASAPQVRLSEAELDQLLAPIALYPDQLLSQILMASTYPLEVVQANRWVHDPKNAALKGDRLAAALETIDWDPSVKALIPFPQILVMMDQHLDWMQNLGDAFLAQQDDVMMSVQRLRQRAAAAGNLQTTPQQVVTLDGSDYVIQPANPTFVYLPVYDPFIVYGGWPYPLYPPYYFPPPPGLYIGPVIYHAVRFSIAFTIVHLLWDWNRWDWHRHRLFIDRNRYNVINRYFIEHRRRPRLVRDTWQHDVHHRRGVVYRDSVTHNRFRPSPAAVAPARNRLYRGYEGGTTTQPVRPPARAAPGRTPSAERGRPSGPVPGAQGRPAPPRAPSVPRTTAPRPPTVSPPQARAPVPATPPAVERPGMAPRRPATRTAPRPTTPVARPGQTGAAPRARAPRPPTARPQQRAAPRPSTPPPAAQRRTVAPAFQSFSRGSDVRSEARRGRESRQTIVPRTAPRSRPSDSRRAPADGGKSGRSRIRRRP